MPRLTLVQGYRDSVVDEHHVELVVSRAERLVLSDKLRGYLRSASRLIDGGHHAAAQTYLSESLRLVEQDARRALAAEPECPCGVVGTGHGPADSEAMAA